MEHYVILGLTISILLQLNRVRTDLINIPSSNITVTSNGTSYLNWSADKVIDGVINNQGVVETCNCCTALRRPSWVQLTLDKIYLVEQILVIGRIDTYHQFENIQLSLGRQDGSLHDEVFTAKNQTVAKIILTPPREVSTVRVAGSGTSDYMTICEIMVYQQTDTDECAAGTSGCAHQCTNTPGSYVCSCFSGYWLWTDKHTCNYDNCTFESDSTCAWTDVTSGDGFDWTLTYGAKGKYMYIGTSGTRQTGDRAWLISPLLLPVPHTERCLQFGYNMNGPSIGLLSVYMATHGERPGSLLWRMSGDQGQEWKGASVELNSLDQYQVIIEAVVGNSYFGDIAIDDLSILPKTCQLEKGLLIG